MGMPRGENTTIQEVVKYIENGEYRIPRFQRDFVWEIKKSAELIDSIFRGYPIGSIIVWETKSKLTCVDKKDLGGIKIPGKDTGRYTSYIIDGQQRLTSLFMAVMGKTSGKGDDFSQICVSLTATGSEPIVYSALPKDADPGDYVSLMDLYMGTGYKGKHPDIWFKYRDILLQYTISVIKIDDEQLGLEQVVEIFERLNLGGKKLNMFSIVAARCYFPETEEEEGFDLTKKIKELNEYLKSKNYGEIADSTFLQVISACVIGKVQKAEILKKLKEKEVRANYENIERALLDAIQHLKGKAYGVAVAGLLPYERLLVPFAYFHFKRGKRPITVNQEKYLCDFFWRCVLLKRYSNAADANTDNDLLRIKTILAGNKPDQLGIVLSPKSIFENGRFQLSSGYVLGMLCLMAQNNPQSFAEGRTIGITDTAVSKGAKKQYHHFFPKQSEVIQGNNDYKRIVNNVVNIVFMDSVTNNQIKNQNPSKYIKKFGRKNSRMSSILKSHYIAKIGFGIENDDFYEFINARSNALFIKLKEHIVVDRKHDTVITELPFE